MIAPKDWIENTVIKENNITPAINFISLSQSSEYFLSNFLS